MSGGSAPIPPNRPMNNVGRMNQAKLVKSLPKIYPSIFIGLGGTGNEVIRRVKREMLQHGYNSPLFQYLVLDTVTYREKQDMNPLEHLRDGIEYLYIGGYNPNQIVNNLSRWPTIERWWGSKDRQNLVTVDEGAGQLRAVGRMAFFRHSKEILARLEQAIREAKSRSHIEAAQREYEINGNEAPVVYLVFSLCGGTGSSLFLDIAYVMRELIGQQTKVIGLAVLPGPFLQKINSLPQQERIQANAYAALQELERLHNMALQQGHQQQGNTLWDVQYTSTFRVTSSEAPFNHIYLIDDKTEDWATYKRDEVFDLMGQALFWLAGPTAAAQFRERADNLISNNIAGGGIVDGTGRLRFPRYSSVGVSVCAIDWQGEEELARNTFKRELFQFLNGKRNNKLQMSNAPVISVMIDQLAKEQVDRFWPKMRPPNGLYESKRHVKEKLDGDLRFYDGYFRQTESNWRKYRIEQGRQSQEKIDTFLYQVLTRYGPVVAQQQAESLLMQLAQCKTDKLSAASLKAKTEENDADSHYKELEKTLVAPDPALRRVFLRGRQVLTGKAPQADRTELRNWASSGATMLYRQKKAEFEVKVANAIEQDVVDPLITHLQNRVIPFLNAVNEYLLTWQEESEAGVRSEEQRSDARQKGQQEGQFEPVILISPGRPNPVAAAINAPSAKFEQFVRRALEQAFIDWPNNVSSTPEDLALIRTRLETAINAVTTDAIKGGVRQERVLERLMEPGASWHRKRFLERAQCLWNYDQDISQTVEQRLEPIWLLGVGEPVDDPVVIQRLDELLKDQKDKDRLERMPIGTPNEMVLLKTRHGLPITWVHGMYSLHRAYEVMRNVRHAPYLHTDYRDEVFRGYVSLVDDQRSPAQVIRSWKGVTRNKKGVMYDAIRAAIQNYEKSIGDLTQDISMDDAINIRSQYDPLLRLIDEIEQATSAERNRDEGYSEVLIELSETSGLASSQGWEKINGRWEDIKVRYTGQQGQSGQTSGNTPPPPNY